MATYDIFYMNKSIVLTSNARLPSPVLSFPEAIAIAMNKIKTCFGFLRRSSTTVDNQTGRLDAEEPKEEDRVTFSPMGNDSFISV